LENSVDENYEKKKKKKSESQNELKQLSLDIFFSPNFPSPNIPKYQPILLPTLSNSIENVNNHRWPIFLEPFVEESLSSWMTRIALANHTDLPSLITFIGENPNNFDYDIVLKENIIQILVQKTGITAEMMKNISLYHEKKSYDLFFAENPNHI
jgi:hypothetical protein